MAPAGASGVILALLAGCGADLSPVTSVQDPVSIPIEDSLPQERRLSAPAGWPIAVTIAGQGVDVKATVVAGGESRHCDAPNRRMGVETLLVEAGHGGAIAIRIERNDHSGARGLATLEAFALPSATADDRTRLEALRQESRACLAFPQLARAAESAADYQAAARTWRGLGDGRRAGLALLHAAGVRYLRNADWRSASALAAEAYSDLERVDAAPHAAYALRLEGAALDQLANAADHDRDLHDETVQRARDRLTEAGRRFDELGLPYEAGFAYSYRGVSHHVSGTWDRSRSDFQLALTRFQAAGDEPAQAIALQSLAYQSLEDGRSQDAAREFERALALIPRDEDPANYAHTLQNSALPLRILGRFDEAIARHHESAEILRGLGDREGEARALQGIGVALTAIGDLEHAAGLLRTAIQLRGEGGAGNEQAIALVNLAEIERAAGRGVAAIALDRQALALVTMPLERARVLLSLARDQVAAGEPAEARKSLDALFALGLSPSNRFVAQAKVELADLEFADGDRARADALFEQALAAQRDSSAEFDRARTLQRRASARFRGGDQTGALADAVKALEDFDAIGIQGLQAEARATFRAGYRDALELQIEILLRQAESAGSDKLGQSLLRQALWASDRARARLLAESAGENGVTGASAVAKERAQVYELLAGKRQQSDRLLDLGRGDSDRALDLARDIESLRSRARILDGRIAQGRAMGAQRSSPESVPFEEWLSADTVVAEYFIGRRHGWLFEIRDGRVAVHQLAAHGEVEDLARDLHLAWRTTARHSAGRAERGRALARRIFGPISKPPTGEFWIIPDGALHVVPMALLARLHWRQLSPGAAIVMPALSTLRPASEAADTSQGAFAVVADPVYEADDPRIRVARAAQAERRNVARSARGTPEFRRLPGAAIEARDVASLIADPDRKLVLLGTEASRQRLQAAELERFRVVHFALHAVADSRDPALAMLALSQFDAAGQPQVGAFRLYDIVALRLNAELVVLSGCDTAIGHEIAGEGPIGLSHAFLRAGARSVVATLWQVPDSSTAVLMREFYREMLINGRSASAALEIAQAAVRRQLRWSDPYFWAGFQLVSNTRQDAGNNNDVAGREES